jgi:hypothetical protein
MEVAPVAGQGDGGRGSRGRRQGSGGDENVGRTDNVVKGESKRKHCRALFFSHGAGAVDTDGNVKWRTETYFATVTDHTCSNIISRDMYVHAG